MTETYANRAQSVLSFSIDDNDLTLQVESADDPVHGFPLEGNFRIVIDDEIILVGARSSTVFSSLTREVEGTTAASHLAGAPVVHTLTIEGFTTGVTELIETVIMVGSGSPEGVVTADPTMMYRDELNNEVYMKAGGTGNTGWVKLTHPDATAHAGYALMTANDHTQYVQETAANAKGDMFAGQGNDSVTRLAVGTNGQRLTADSTKTEGVKWA